MIGKRSGACCAVFLAAVMLTGCGEGRDNGALQLREKEEEKTVLTLFLPIDTVSYGVETYKDAITDYNRSSVGMEIRADGISTADGYNQALCQRLEAGGEGADLFIVNADMVKELYQEGYFYDLSELPSAARLSETAKEQSMIDGTVYAIPLQMTAYGIYVNVGLLKEYGLEPPQKLEEFMECCLVLKENGITPVSLNRWYAMNTFVMARGLYPIYQSADKQLILAGLNDGSIWIGDYMIEGFRLFDQMVEMGYFGDSLRARKVDSIKAGTSDLEDFVNGRTAFAVFPMGSEDMIEDAAPDMDFIQQGFPVLPDGTVSLPAVSSRLCVNAKGPHLKAALDAAAFLTSAETSDTGERFKTGISSFITEQSKTDDPRIQPIYEDMISPGQIPIEDMSLHFTYWDTTRELCLKIIDGMSPEEAAEEYNRIQQEQINVY